VTAAASPIAGPTLTANGPIPWPADGPGPSTAPLVLSGSGIRVGTVQDARLDAVAPTLAAAIGLDRRFPDVRSGTALGGVASPPGAKLLLVASWKGGFSWPARKRYRARSFSAFGSFGARGAFNRWKYATGRPL